MSWLQISFAVDSQIVDALSDTLEGIFAQAVTAENAGADEFYEVAFPGKPDWKKVVVTALFSDEIEPQPIIDFVHKAFGEQGEIPTSVEKLKDQDWERVWLDSFKPINVGNALWVCPSWCEPVAPEERNIILDPGLAFGTGTHPTTNMCLQWLSEQNLSDQTVLDYGSGSGILAIAALLSGAKHADAVDIDPLAVSAAAENAQRNNVGDRLSSYLPQALPEGQYPLVIANILAEVIVELKITLLTHLEKNGVILLTGILESQVDRVRNVFAEDIHFEVRNSEQWCLLIGQLT